MPFHSTVFARESTVVYFYLVDGGGGPDQQERACWPRSPFSIVLARLCQRPRTQGGGTHHAHTHTSHTHTRVSHTRFLTKREQTEPATNSSHTGAGLQRSRWLQDGPVPRARHASPVCDHCPPRSETVRTHQLSACANISANILSKSFGFVRWGYRPRTCPSRPTTNLVKFHSIFSPSSGVPFRNL